MKQRFFRALGALFVTMTAASAIALAAGSPTIESTPIPKPAKPDFSAMRFLLGTWTCLNKSSRRSSAYTVVTTNSMDPTGYWMIGKDVTTKTSWYPYDVNSTDMTTYDSDTHRWVDIFTGDLGLYGVSTSPGWKGDTMVWTDALFAPSADILSVTPLVETKVSDTKTTAITTFKEKSGRTITVNTVCKKSG